MPLDTTISLEATTRLTVGPDGNLWFSEESTDGTSPASPGAIGRITPAGTITEFPLPAGYGSPSGLTVGPDGNLWFSEELYSDLYPTGAIDRITPAGALTEFPIPGGDGPGDLTVAPDGNFWFLEIHGGTTASYSIGRITPAGTITQFPLPAGYGFLGDLTAGPDGNLWFPDGGDRPDHASRCHHRVPAPGRGWLPGRPDGRPRRQPLVHCTESRGDRADRRRHPPTAAECHGSRRCRAYEEDDHLDRPPIRRGPGPGRGQGRPLLQPRRGGGERADDRLPQGGEDRAGVVQRARRTRCGSGWPCRRRGRSR